eukprot:gene9209-16885_t
MAVSAAQLLDELMGKDRNRAPGEPSSRMHWSDSEVCKYFLCGFCPHELFTNTKADLGACPKAHDEALKKEYEKSNRRGLMGYEETFHRFLQGIMADVERRIRRGHERLALNAKKEQQELKTAKGDDDQLSMITDHINQLLGEIETLGSEGKVEEAQGIMKLVDQLKEEKETLMQMSKLNPLSSQEKQMEVCEICGAFLIVGDAQSRVDDHLQGKQHVGYARIKAAVEDMKNKSRLNSLFKETRANGGRKFVKKKKKRKREQRKEVRIQRMKKPKLVVEAERVPGVKIGSGVGIGIVVKRGRIAIAAEIVGETEIEGEAGVRIGEAEVGSVGAEVGNVEAEVENEEAKVVIDIGIGALVIKSAAEVEKDEGVGVEIRSEEEAAAEKEAEEVEVAAEKGKRGAGVVIVVVAEAGLKAGVENGRVQNPSVLMAEKRIARKEMKKARTQLMTSETKQMETRKPCKNKAMIKESLSDDIAKQKSYTLVYLASVSWNHRFAGGVLTIPKVVCITLTGQKLHARFIS